MLGFLRRGNPVKAAAVDTEANAGQQADALPALQDADEATPVSIADDLIDVRRVIAELSIEELCESADDYYRKLKRLDYHLAKPFAIADEMPEALLPFIYLLQGMDIVAGMRVLDFGAGTCWASRLLTQLGCEVIALDASAQALEIGRELYARQPVIGDQPAPQFSVFNGRTIDLPDASVDRIICLDAFHHVPNQAQALAEMSRVLRDGGVAGFSEPGPEHSKTPKSQYEMRMYRVVENDVVVEDIWATAQSVGFTDCRLSIWNPKPFTLSLAEFNDYLAGGEQNARFADAARGFMFQYRSFLLSKGARGTSDSRQRAGLSAHLKIELATQTVKAGDAFKAVATVTNTGSNVWLPATAGKGAVYLGVHLFDDKGALLDLDYTRYRLTPGGGRPIEPAETVTLELVIEAPAPGRYFFEFDLVSELISWFEHNGSPTVKHEIEVI